MKLRQIADEREIDRIARQAIAGDRVTRHMLAVLDFQAHANGIGQDEISRREIGRAEREDQRQFLMREAEDDENDQPDREGAESQNRHALQKADQVSHASPNDFRPELTWQSLVDDPTSSLVYLSGSGYNW